MFAEVSIVSVDFGANQAQSWKNIGAVPDDPHGFMRGDIYTSGRDDGAAAQG